MRYLAIRVDTSRSKAACIRELPTHNTATHTTRLAPQKTCTIAQNLHCCFADSISSLVFYRFSRPVFYFGCFVKVFTVSYYRYCKTCQLRKQTVMNGKQEVVQPCCNGFAGYFLVSQCLDLHLVTVLILVAAPSSSLKYRSILWRNSSYNPLICFIDSAYCPPLLTPCSFSCGFLGSIFVRVFAICTFQIYCSVLLPTHW